MRTSISCIYLVGLWMLLIVFQETPAWAYADSSANNKAFIITGLSGTRNFNDQFQKFSSKLQDVLLTNGFSQDQIQTFTENEPTDRQTGTYLASSRVLEKYLSHEEGSEETYDDIFVAIAGHASGYQEQTMFHLPGEDVSYEQMMNWIDQIPAKRLVLLLIAPRGQVWIDRLSGEGRVLVVANALEEHDFIPAAFLRFFPMAFDLSLDSDSDWETGKRKVVQQGQALFADEEGGVQTQAPIPSEISLSDLFVRVQKQVQSWYYFNHYHLTELAHLEADGDGIGQSLIEKEPMPLDQLENLSETIVEGAVDHLQPQYQRDLWSFDQNHSDSKMAEAILFQI